MSKYTTEIRFICEFYAGLDESAGYTSISDTIAAAQSFIFDFDYPFFSSDADIKDAFEQKILRYFYTYEIGLETVGLWKLELSNKLNAIMPFYNQLYASELLEFDPFENVNYHRANVNTGAQATNTDSTTTNATTNTGTTDTTETSEGSEQGSKAATGTSAQTQSQSGETTENNKPQTQTMKYELFSDTPESSLSGVENETYLTEARKITEQTSGTGTGGAGDSRTTETTGGTDTAGATTDIENDSRESEGSRTSTTDTAGNSTSTTGNSSESQTTNTDTGNEHMQGKAPGETYSEMLNKYRNTFLNVDLMVIEELKELFMLIY